MGLNPRIYFRSFQRVIFEENLLFTAIGQVKKLLGMILELNSESKMISQSIVETNSKFEITRTVIDSGSKNKHSSINFVR